jgi:biopolymer transport protein ExbD
MAIFKRKRKRMGQEKPAEIPMTPMIDVVFQLLVYFIFTLKVEDVTANLDVLRPRPDAVQDERPPPRGLIRIEIYANEGYRLQERPVTLQMLGSRMERLAEQDREATVLITVSQHSTHEQLIAVLDQCTRVQLTRLAVVSGN